MVNRGAKVQEERHKRYQRTHRKLPLVRQNRTGAHEHELNQDHPQQCRLSHYHAKEVGVRRTVLEVRDLPSKVAEYPGLQPERLDDWLEADVLLDRTRDARFVLF